MFCVLFPSLNQNGSSSEYCSMCFITMNFITLYLLLILGRNGFDLDLDVDNDIAIDNDNENDIDDDNDVDIDIDIDILILFNPLQRKMIRRGCRPRNISS